MRNFTKRLENYPSQKWLLITFFVSTVCMIIVFIIIRPVETELKSISSFGVMELEFAWTLDQIELIFQFWGSELIIKELYVTLLDYFFLCMYSLFFSSVTLLLTRGLESSTFQTIGYYFSILPFLAAFFDAIENLNLIIMLISYPSIEIPAFIPFFASSFALLKFSLLIVIILYWISLSILVIKKKIFQ